MNKEELKVVAEKFGKVPAEITKKADIIAGGYMTEEEFAELPNCPRTPMTSATSWPKIGGRKTYPLSGTLNAEERRMYYDYKKNHNCSRTVSVGKGPSEEVQKHIDSIRAFLKEKGTPELIAEFEAIIPQKKVGLVEEMFGVSSPNLLTGKVNLAYVMFRGPNGEFAEELQPNGADLFAKGFMPKYGLQQIKDNLAKLENKGIKMSGCIVDLQ